jgi:transcriptional regulator with XRE-family HTH domain
MARKKLTEQQVTNMFDFGIELKKILSNLKITQKSLAQKLSCDPGLVTKWLSGESQISANHLNKLCHELGLDDPSIQMLFDLTDYMYKTQEYTSSDGKVNINMPQDYSGIWPMGEYDMTIAKYNKRMDKDSIVWDITPKIPNTFHTLFPSEPVVTNFDLSCTLDSKLYTPDSAIGVVYRSNKQGFWAFLLNLQHQDYIFTYWDSQIRSFRDTIQWTRSNLINSNSNHVRIIANNKDILAFINEKLVGSIEDKQYTSGSTGLIVEGGKSLEPLELRATGYELKIIHSSRST